MASRQKMKSSTEKSTDTSHTLDFNMDQERKGLSDSEDEVKHDETPIADKLMKKRPVSVDEDMMLGMGSEVQTMLEKFGADINKTMQAKRKRLESYTRNSLKGSNQKLEQMWRVQQTQRQKLTQDYCQQVFTVLQQWETDVRKSEEQEEKLNTLLRQQHKLFQQAKVIQAQKLKSLRQLYEQFTKNMEEMEKSHQTFLTDAQAELKKDMAALQKRIMMDTQQQEMATVRKSLHSMLF